MRFKIILLTIVAGVTALMLAQKTTSQTTSSQSVQVSPGNAAPAASGQNIGATANGAPPAQPGPGSAGNVPPGGPVGPGNAPGTAPPQFPNLVTNQNISPTQMLSPQNFATNAIVTNQMINMTNIGLLNVSNGTINVNVNGRTNFGGAMFNTNLNINTNRPHWWEK